MPYRVGNHVIDGAFDDQPANYWQANLRDLEDTERSRPMRVSAPASPELQAAIDAALLRVEAAFKRGSSQ